MEEEDIILIRVSLEENHGHPFTKPLSQIKHDGHT